MHPSIKMPFAILSHSSFLQMYILLHTVKCLCNYLYFISEGLFFTGNYVLNKALYKLLYKNHTHTHTHINSKQVHIRYLIAPVLYKHT